MSPRHPLSEELLEACAQHDARALHYIWGQNPTFVREHYAALFTSEDDLTLERALVWARAKVRETYAGGTCTLCGGRARLCAPRHTKGQSCW